MISVNCVTMMLSVGLIVATAGVVLGVTLSYSLGAADDFATRYSGATAAAGVNRVRDYLTIPVARYRGVAFATSAGLLPNVVGVASLPARDAMLDLYSTSLRQAIFETDFAVQYVNVGFADRSSASCVLLSAAAKMHMTLQTDAMNVSVFPPGLFWTKQRMYAGAALFTSTAFPNPIDPTVRPWYVNASKAYGGPPRFSDIYLSAGQVAMPTLDVAGPLFGSSVIPFTPGPFMGVASVSLDLSALSAFLTTVAHTSTPNTAVALLDNSGYLLAVSSGAPLWSTGPYNATSDGPITDPACATPPSLPAVRVCRFTLGTFNASAALNAVARELGGLATGPLVEQATVQASLGGSTHYVTAAPVAVAGATNMAWRLVVVVPAADIMGEILRGRDLALILAAIVIVVACVACAVALWLLLRPLAALADRMEDTATLRDELLAEDGDRSRLAEVRAIQDAFYRLCGQLKKAKSFLPASLLAQMESDDGEEEAEEEEEHKTVDEGTASDASPLELHSRPSMYSGSGSPNGTLRRHASSDFGSPDVRSVRRHASMSTIASIVSKSSSPTHQKVASTSSSATRRAAAKLAAVADISISQRTVSVLALNLRGFHATVRADPTALGLRYGDMVDQAASTVRSLRGVLDSFHGDRLIATFNAVRPAGAHAAVATSAAVQLLGRLRGDVSAGVATGGAMVGNMGSATQRRFGTVGHAFTQATVLERMCRHYAGVGVLLPATTAAEAITTCDLVNVDVALLPGGQQPVVLSAAVALTAGVGADEWMYELSAAAKGSRTTVLNDAFALLVGGRFDEAEASLKQHDTPQAQPADPDAARRKDAAVCAERAMTRWIAQREVRPAALGAFYDTCIAPATTATGAVPPV